MGRTEDRIKNLGEEHTGDTILYLDKNGITIKCTKKAEIGKTYELNGQSYLIVDKEMLRERIKKGEDVTNVCTSYVNEMFAMFKNAKYFNHDISSWDVSNVFDMKEMFHGSESFNQNISNWDVSNVTNMNSMFYGATYFNQPINPELFTVAGVK